MLYHNQCTALGTSTCTSDVCLLPDMYNTKYNHATMLRDKYK